MNNVLAKNLVSSLRDFFQSNLTPTPEDIVAWAKQQEIWRVNTIKSVVSQLKTLGYFDIIDGKYVSIKLIPSNYTTYDLMKEYNKYKYLKSLEQ